MGCIRRYISHSCYYVRSLAHLGYLKNLYVKNENREITLRLIFPLKHSDHRQAAGKPSVLHQLQYHCA